MNILPTAKDTLSTLTDKERAVLKAHYRHAISEMGGPDVDGIRNDNFSFVWARELADLSGLPRLSTNGVIGSLMVKCLQDSEPNPSYHQQDDIYLTEHGLDVLKLMEDAGELD